MRLFFALWPGPVVRTRLAALTDEARQQVGGRRIPDDKLHLTLAFLGDVSPRKTADLVALTGRLTCLPATWKIDRLGHFPRGGIVWAGSQTLPAALDALHEELWAALAELGFIPPARVFVPHVTLLRKASGPPREPSADMPLDWHYTRVALVHSAVDGPRRRYEILAQTDEPGQ